MSPYLFVTDPPAALDEATDTSLLLMRELRRRGHRVDQVTPADLGLEDGAAVVRAGGERRGLGEYAAVLMRKDPPFDTDYLLATLVLERARGTTLLVNDPRGLREANEKLFALEFAEFTPPSAVTAAPAEVLAFVAAHGGEAVVKPLDGCGGRGVFRLRADDPNIDCIAEVATAGGRRAVMVQEYLPAAREGDKRIFLLDGEPLGAILRVPRGDSARCNLHAGGSATATTLTARERAIAASVGARCRRDGLLLVGLDVIGGWLTEVNVTSPTGLVELGALEGRDAGAEVARWLERRVTAPLALAA